MQQVTRQSLLMSVFICFLCPSSCSLFFIHTSRIRIRNYSQNADERKSWLHRKTLKVFTSFPNLLSAQNTSNTWKHLWFSTLTWFCGACSILLAVFTSLREHSYKYLLTNVHVSKSNLFFLFNWGGKYNGTTILGVQPISNKENKWEYWIGCCSLSSSNSRSSSILPLYLSFLSCIFFWIFYKCSTKTIHK